MGGTILTLALAGGGLLLASWVDAKVGESRPASPIKLIGLCFVGVLLLGVSASHRAGVDIASERTCDFRPHEVRRMAADVAVETSGPCPRGGRAVHPRPDDHARVEDRANDGLAPVE